MEQQSSEAEGMENPSSKGPLLLSALLLICILVVGYVYYSYLTGGKASTQLQDITDAEIQELESRLAAAKKEVQTAISHLRAKDELVREFIKIFPDARHRFQGYAHATPVFALEVLLYGRYVMTLQFEVTFSDRINGMSHRSGPPTFMLHEPGPADVEADGRLVFGRAGPLNNAVLSIAEWKNLVEAEGDFSVINKELVKNQPNVLFKQHWDTVEFGGY